MMGFKTFSQNAWIKYPPSKQLQSWKGLFSDVRTRILIWYFLLATCITLSSIWATFKIFCFSEQQHASYRLSQDIQAFQSAINKKSNSSPPSIEVVKEILQEFIDNPVGEPHKYLLLVLDGHLYTTNPLLLPPVLQKQPNLVQKWATPNNSKQLHVLEGYIIRVVQPIKVKETNQAVILGIYDATSRYQMGEKTLWLVIKVSLAGILLFSAIAWISAGKVLAPIRSVTETARSITETDLNQRLSVRGNDEMAELTLTFNQMLDRLQAAFISQQDFIRDVSHELRTPITIIRGHLDLMGDSPIEREETVALVKDELQRMNRFVNDLLLLMKTERPNFLRLETVDIANFTEEVFLKTKGLAHRDWQLEAKAEGNMVLDRQRITQVILNLAQNATQYTPPGDVIAIGSKIVGHNLHFWVKDSGEGINIEDQERIFHRFARGKNGERRSEGSGLGLSIVQALIKAHDGHVELCSRLGQGSTFTIIIPISR